MLQRPHPDATIENLLARRDALEAEIDQIDQALTRRYSALNRDSHFEQVQSAERQRWEDIAAGRDPWSLHNKQLAEEKRTKDAELARARQQEKQALDQAREETIRLVRGF